MYFETHAHYDDSAFDSDREEVLSALRGDGVEAVINPGCDIWSSLKAREIAASHEFVWFAAGVHPEEISDLPEDWLKQISEISDYDRCVAIGEIGLDYYWDASQKDLQKEVFEAQLLLAEKKKLPVIIHDREAHGDCFEIVSRHPKVCGVFHCYSGSSEMAVELLKRGWYLGFDGPVTYKNARKTLEVLAVTPPERILIETDSPYMAPVPMRGKRNDSRNLHHIAAKIAEVKGMTTEELSFVTSRNAKTLFRLS